MAKINLANLTPDNNFLTSQHLSFSEGDCTEYQESAAQSFLICGRLRKRKI